MKRVKLFLTFLLYANAIYAAPFKEAYYTQTLDHFNSGDHRTFQQRYLFDSSAAKNDNAPIVFFIGNEADLETLLNHSYVPEFAHQLKAHFVALEHRYYGKSQPFTELTTNHLKYLTYANALQDLAQFQNDMRREKGWHGKWVAIGQSYGGNLAAFYRQKYPEQIAGSIASSPGVRTVLTWPEYDKRAAEKAGRDCVQLYRKEILTPIEMAMNNPDELHKYKELFDANDVNDDEEFVYLLGYTSDMMVSFFGSDKFCQSMYAANPMNAYHNLYQSVMTMLHNRLIDFTDKGIEDINAASYAHGIGQRQWIYQVCTEFADMTIANPDTALSLISQTNKLDPYETCRKVYGINALPDPEKMDQQYYFPLLNLSTTNILIMNGSEDPVATLSVSDENGNNVNPNIQTFTIAGGAHHSELHEEQATDSAAIKEARKKELAALQVWLR